MSLEVFRTLYTVSRTLYTVSRALYTGYLLVYWVPPGILGTSLTTGYFPEYGSWRTLP